MPSSDRRVVDKDQQIVVFIDDVTRPFAICDGTAFTKFAHLVHRPFGYMY